MKFLKPKFWDQQYLTIQSVILYPFTFILDLKEIFNFFFLDSKKFSKIKTICVGNIYLGGTGKTPLVDYLGINLRKKFRTVIIKKNYSDQLDEKRLLEINNKVLFMKSRVSSLNIAIQKKFELAIFDDGLQDKSIKYDLKIVCFDPFTLAGNQLRLPSGPLRESLDKMKKYDVVFFKGKFGNQKFLKKIKRINPNIGVFYGDYLCTNPKKFKKNFYLVFSGIGNPNSFKDTLKKYKIKFALHKVFPDHYNYSKFDMFNIRKIAKSKNLKILTTEKDYYRIPKKFRKNIQFLKMKFKVKNSKKFDSFINKYL